MINFRNAIVSKLHNFTGRPVIHIPTNQKIPNYPFVTYSIINAYINDSSYSTKVSDVGDYIIDRKVENNQFVISFNVYAKDAFENKILAKQCRDFFLHIGRLELSDLGIVVVDATDIQNRDLLDVDEYERKEGFDVTFRLAENVDAKVETIEAYTITEKE